MVQVTFVSAWSSKLRLIIVVVQVFEGIRLFDLAGDTASF
jgi:hypothetical protein